MNKKPFGFLQDENGDWSNSRLIANSETTLAWILMIALLIIKLAIPATVLMDIVLPLVTLYGGIAIQAKIFLYGQKKTEIKNPIPTEEITN